MPAIKVLHKSIAELIAAGEVVERPASVAKELIENAIDAGATDISVEISGGGISMLKVSDNGCGIEKDDIPKAFLRHATSKVENVDDLDGILTLGFRGEALASIAAMCKVEIVSKAANSPEAYSYKIEGGEGMELLPAARPKGTTITVRDTFFNTPARMKFLKKDSSEGNSVAGIIDKCALSHPEIAFKFIRDGIVKLQTSGNRDLLAVIYSIYGRQFASEMLPVDYIYENFGRVTGYISKPSGVKPSRAYQTFFINSRYVKTKTGMAALEEAYRNKIMSGKFPACVLNLEIDAACVDVNVHPAKIEVRFENEKPVFSSFYYAVKSTLSALDAPLDAHKSDNISAPFEIQDEQPVQQKLTAMQYRQEYVLNQHSGPQKSIYSESAAAFFNKPISMGAKNIDICVDDGVNAPALDAATYSVKKIHPVHDNILNDIAVKEGISATTTLEIKCEETHSVDYGQETQDFRLIGELFSTYILIQRGDDLVLVDKHAAHERIIYERLKAEIPHGQRQILLTPHSVALTHSEHTVLMDNLDEVTRLGFLIEDFGGNSVLVREVPTELTNLDISFIMGEIAGKLINNAKDLTPHILDRLYYSIACRSAVKAGDKNNHAEFTDIVEKLRKNPSVTHCPHGRPVLIKISRKEIEKMFGRLG